MDTQRRVNGFSIGNALLASVMVVCFVTAATRAVGVFEAAWFANLASLQREITIGAFLVSLEVQLTRRWLEPEQVFSPEWWERILLEWGFLLVSLLVFVWVIRGPQVSWNDLPGLSGKVVEVVGRPEFYEGLLLLIVVWSVSRLLTHDLMALENIPVAASRDAIRGLVEEQNTVRNRLWQDVLLLGGVMVILSVFSITIAHVLFSLPLTFGALGMETLVFFLCGFGLFVIGRLLFLRAEWVTERTGIDPSVTRHWVVYGMSFVLFLLLVAAVLPTQFTFQLLHSLRLVLAGISTALSILWIAVVFPIVWGLSRLFPSSAPPTPGLPQPSAEPTPAQTIPALPSGATWEMVAREILFWGAVLLVGVYILRRVLPLRFAVVRRLRRFFLFRRLFDLLYRLRRRFQVWRNVVARTIRESWEALREDLSNRGGGERGGFLNVRGLDPRQSIRFYFFAMIRRGAERGTVRRPAQTPREYAASLSQTEERIHEELRELTAAFEEARYTAHPLGPEEARRVRRLWDTIRATLRSPRLGEKVPGNLPRGTSGNRME